MDYMSRTTKVHFLRILVLFSVLILAIGLSTCSKSPTEPKVIQKAADGSEFHDSALSGSQVLQTSATSTCFDGNHDESNAVFHICIPALWNGDLVVYAHGFVAPDKPLVIQDDKVEGTPISQIVTGLGFAFATTSYYTNGLVEPELGIEDLEELVDIFDEIVDELELPEPSRVYLVGASEGGLITVLAVEESDEFDGGLAGCGPIGDFRTQIDYFGDFRVVFDFFFPGVILDSPISISPATMQSWNLGLLQLAIINAISANPFSTAELLFVTNAPIDPTDLNSVGQTVLGILFYNIFATNDAISKLGGQPFDNSNRLYTGSSNAITIALNSSVQRFSADEDALEEIEEQYQTSGELDIPLVTIHTTDDEIVPFVHETLYLTKVLTSGSSLLHTNFPDDDGIVRYGHCDFTVNELLTAFSDLVAKVTTQQLTMN